MAGRGSRKVIVSLKRLKSVFMVSNILIEELVDYANAIVVYSFVGQYLLS
jgi:hypothetical protein